MARKYKSRVGADKLDVKIEQQKEALEKAKARYDAVINSSKSYEEILAFVKGEGLTE